MFITRIEGDTVYYKLEDESNLPVSEKLFYDLTGISVQNIASLDLLTWSTLLSLGLAAALAVAWRSPYPIAVGLFLITFANVYRNSESVFENFEINPYIKLVFFMGVLLLIIITIIEYFTHGDVSHD